MQRRQSIIPLPIPSNYSSEEEKETISESEIEIIESDNDQYEVIAPTLEIPENILPLKEPAKVASEFSKFFEERTGRRPFSQFTSPNVMESLQRPSSTVFQDSSNTANSSQSSHPTRPNSPSGFKALAGISPEDDIKSKLEILELNVPGKLKLERADSNSSAGVNTDESAGNNADTEESDQFDGAVMQKPKSWIAPESWAVIAPLMASELPGRQNNSDLNAELSAIRIYKIDSKHHRTASIVNMMDSFFQPSVLLACPLNTPALEICVTLTQKYFTSYDSSRYRLYVTHGGIERMLAKDDQPLLLQLNWLKEIGYTEADEMSKLGRDDHSYLFRFVFREVPVKNRILPESSMNDDTVHSKKTKITQRTAHLADENLSVIPVALYKNAPTLESLDLSKNTLLDLPEDFFEMLRSLRILVLKNNCLYSVPPAVFQLPRLTHLNLSQNHLDAAAIRHLSKLTNLTNLDLSCNQLESLPEAFSQFKNLVFLNLSTNRFTLFPGVIFDFKGLKDLNLSFNSISAIPDGIDALQSLRTFSMTGNALTYISPKISNLKHLKLLDVRGNLFQDMSGITHLPSLTEVHAQYNNVTRISEMSWRYMSMLYLENNGLTSLHFGQVLLNLKVLNMSSCKLAGLPNDFFNFIPNVHTVNLDRNQLISLPESINTTAWLENLSVSYNSLNELHLNFSRLINLKCLDLHGNNLKSFNSEIWQSPCLNVLNLSSNFLSEFPDPPTSFEALPLALSLNELYLADNRFKTESLYNLSGLTNLMILNLNCNEIVDLEENLNSMHRLTEFYVSDNEITSLPDEIDKWTNLRILHLNGNRFMSLSFDLCRNGKLEVLDASGNNLKYNISNYPYDWNWAWNVELKYLNLGDNRRLEIKPDARVLDNRDNRSVNGGKSLVDFRNLVKLRFLNVAQVNIADESVPLESTSLRVRRDWHVTDVPKIGIAQWCGRKASFDTFDVISKRFLNQPGHHVAALFSGRSESLVSLHLYDTFLYDLETEINRIGGVDALLGCDFGRVLRRAFLNCNRRLSTQPTPVRCGSTATVLYILNNVAWVANVGDTMAILSREGQAVNLSTRHHPWSRPEIDRIRGLGGFVSANGLVAGELDICRAFGYFHLLPFVNANPSISQTILGDRDEFIILASYELWTFISYQMAVDLVRQFSKDPTRGAYKLRDLAISYGAVQSITVIVFDLKDGTMNTTVNTGVNTSNNTAKSKPNNKDHHVADQVLSRLVKEIDPPTGEVTLVFTDIKDSTTLWELYPAPMRVALRMHDTIMRRSLRRIGGYEVKNDGDSFMASFPNIQTALKWTCSVQKELLEADWPQEIVDSPIAATVNDPRDASVPLLRGLSVRMGMHVGEPFCEIHSVTERMDYTGPTVNFAARVGSAPTGGQIFVTPQVINQYARLSQSCKDDIGPVVIYDMGMMKFKGVEKPERLFAVYPESLEARHQILQKNLVETVEPFLFIEADK